MRTAGAKCPKMELRIARRNLIQLRPRRMEVPITRKRQLSKYNMDQMFFI